MLDILVNNIFVVFAEIFSQQIVGIPMEANCVSRLSDLFLW